MPGQGVPGTVRNESAAPVQVGLTRYNFDQTRAGEDEGRREFLLLSVYQFICYQVENIFVYWIETKKFNWHNFQENYRNMPNHQLFSIIETMYSSL